MLRQRPTGYDPSRSLKTEVLEARDWPVFSDLADAQARVAEYFDYYNHDRRHSIIGNQKPYPFHQQQPYNIIPILSCLNLATS